MQRQRRAPYVWWSHVLAAAGLSLFVAAAFVTWRLVNLHGMRPVTDLLPGVLCVASLLFGYLALSSPGLCLMLHDAVAGNAGRSRWTFAWPGALWSVTLAYAAVIGLPVLARTVAYGLYVAGPVLLLSAGRDMSRNRPLGHDDGPPGAARVVLAMVALLVPAALRLLPRLPVPNLAGTDVSKYLGYGTAAWCFLVLAPVPGMGYAVVADRRSLGIAVAAFVAYAVLAVPLGLTAGFLTWTPRIDARHLLLLPVLLALTTAVAEELVFRGIVQRAIEVATAGRRWGRWVALGVASLLFGLVHLPDPRYVALATLAGVTYGFVYQRTGLLLAPVVTHTLVDWMWALLLRG